MIRSRAKRTTSAPSFSCFKKRAEASEVYSQALFQDPLIWLEKNTVKEKEQQQEQQKNTKKISTHFSSSKRYYVWLLF